MRVGSGLRATDGRKPRQIRKEATVVVRFVCRGSPGVLTTLPDNLAPVSTVAQVRVATDSFLPAAAPLPSLLLPLRVGEAPHSRGTPRRLDLSSRTHHTAGSHLSSSDKQLAVFAVLANHSECVEIITPTALSRSVVTPHTDSVVRKTERECNRRPEHHTNGGVAVKFDS